MIDDEMMCVPSFAAPKHPNQNQSPLSDRNCLFLTGLRARSLFCFQSRSVARFEFQQNFLKRIRQSDAVEGEEASMCQFFLSVYVRAEKRVAAQNHASHYM